MILASVFSSVIDWYLSNMNYLTIMILMAIESTFVPLPSEVVLPPAAWLAAKGEMNLFLIIISASVGCVLGALINYTLSFYLGRIIIYKLADSRYARFFFINREKLQKAEDYFVKNGNISTFIGRLIPGIRHLISIPAGLAKMDLKKFVFFTFVGSLVWNTVLSLLGYFFGKNQDVLMKHFHELQWVALGVGAVFIIYLVFRRIRKSE